MLIYKSDKIGNWAHYNRPECTVVHAGNEQILVGADEEDRPLYEPGDDLFALVGWQDAWGEPPTEEQIADWVEPPPPPPDPVTDVEIYKEVFVTARKNATLLIDTIKASVQDALVKSKAYSRSDATIQGVDFVFCHGDAISKYKEAGGHPAAASKLLSAFKSEGSVALFPWVKSVGAIFDQALTY